ncbi:MAG: GNAT family N-acetyltransferase [Actinomycetota bacterium]
MKPPEGYAERGVTREDAPAILDVIAASDRVLIGEVDYEAEDLADEWGRPRFDLEFDPFVLVTPVGSLVAYAYVWESEPGRVVVSWSAVHPDHDTEEIEAYLLARIEARAREKLAGAEPGAATLRNVAYEIETIAPVLLRREGFEPVRHFWRMAIRLRGDEQPPEAPAGVRLRDFDPDADAGAVHGVLLEAFADHWGTPTGPFEDWTQDFMAGEEYDPTLWVVAEDVEQVAGSLLARRTGDRGWIAELGVRPAWRGRGIGAALLRTSFARFAARGVSEVILSVDSDNVTGATRLYERVGMTSSFRFDFYEKRL